MEEAAKKTSRVRSPGYPMVDLREAILKSKELWNKDKTNPIPREVAAKHLGYENAGGHGGRVLAALKHFGLISFKEGDIILTEKAIDLALHDPNDKVYHDTVQEIALQPDIYSLIFNEYNGSIPSDATLRVKLIKDYKFNADKVDRFITNFRSTIEFARLTAIEEDMGSGDVEHGLEQEQRSLPSRPAISQKPHMEDRPSLVAKHYPIPLSKGMTAVIGFESLPVDKKDIEKIKKWLDLFSDELTTNDGED